MRTIVEHKYNNTCPSSPAPLFAGSSAVANQNSNQSKKKHYFSSSIGERIVWQMTQIRPKKPVFKSLNSVLWGAGTPWYRIH